MRAGDRFILLDDPQEWAAFAAWLTDLDAGLARYRSGLSPRLAALRDQADRWAREARIEAAAKQPAATEQLVDPDGPGMLSTKQVASRFGCSMANITALARRGRLHGELIGGRYRFDVLDVSQYEKRRSA